jgi:PilZ domain-containing protein
MLQRRRWERYRKELDVTVSGDGVPRLLGRTQDVCEGGLGIICTETLTVGDEFQFTIAELGDAPLIGTVRWCTPSAARNANLVGVELNQLSASQSEALAGCIARWKAEDAGRGDG